MTYGLIFVNVVSFLFCSGNGEFGPFFNGDWEFQVFVEFLVGGGLHLGNF